MSYLSIDFIVLVLASLVTYYIFPKKFRWVILLVSSMCFYLSYDNRYIIFLLCSIITTYLSALIISKLNQNNIKILILFACIIVNASIWFIVKDANWIIESLNNIHILSFQVNIPMMNILVPIGISYYVLQSIGYLIHVYKKKIKAEYNIFKYALFVSWFPSIVQGPISRYDQLSKQLFTGHAFDYDAIIESSLLVLYGMIKKIIIADQLAVFANYCFGDFANLSGFVLYVGAIAYSLQLYFDFSGCVNICRGVSGMFGVHLIQNFKSPYFATSIKDFWSRWHISLSTWLKDYIYIPLGGNRKGTSRKYFNIFITFLVSGIWHGAGSGFILWGLLHAVYQIAGDYFVNLRRRIKKWIGVKENSLSESIYQMIITFHLVAFAWIFFRAGSIGVAFDYIGNMIDNFSLWAIFDGRLFQYGISFNLAVPILINIVAIFYIEYQQKQQDTQYRKVIRNLHIPLRWCIYFILIFDVILFGAYGTGFNISSFLYGGF